MHRPFSRELPVQREADAILCAPLGYLMPQGGCNPAIPGEMDGLPLLLREATARVAQELMEGGYVGRCANACGFLANREESIHSAPGCGLQGWVIKRKHGEFPGRGVCRR